MTEIFGYIMKFTNFTKILCLSLFSKPISWFVSMKLAQFKTHKLKFSSLNCMFQPLSRIKKYIAAFDRFEVYVVFSEQFYNTRKKITLM
jgi:hypothetical protein